MLNTSRMIRLTIRIFGVDIHLVPHDIAYRVILTRHDASSSFKFYIRCFTSCKIHMGVNIIITKVLQFAACKLEFKKNYNAKIIKAQTKKCAKCRSLQHPNHKPASAIGLCL